MSFRKITSLTVLVSFLITVLTSAILYIVPHGRVAYWADWRFWRLSKDQWGAIHLNVGFLFILFIILHIFYNWKPIISYLKNTSKPIKIFPKELHIAVLISLFCIIGTYMEIPPFSTVIEIGDHFKEKGAEKYGEPPYGHAELSTMRVFSKKMHLDLQRSMKLLEKAGYKVDNAQQTIQEIAQSNSVSPQDVYDIIKDTGRGLGKKDVLPGEPPAGTGNMALSKFCSKYNLDQSLIVNSLEKKNISLKEDMTIKRIAKDNSINPRDLYYMIKSIVSKQEL